MGCIALRFACVRVFTLNLVPTNQPIPPVHAGWGPFVLQPASLVVAVVPLGIHLLALKCDRDVQSVRLADRVSRARGTHFTGIMESMRCESKSKKFPF